MDIKMYIIGPAYASCKLISPLGGEVSVLHLSTSSFFGRFLSYASAIFFVLALTVNIDIGMSHTKSFLQSFDWNNLYSAVTVEGITVPNTSFTLLLMLVEIAIAIPVILYFDLIMPGR